VPSYRKKQHRSDSGGYGLDALSKLRFAGGAAGKTRANFEKAFRNTHYGQFSKRSDDDNQDENDQPGNSTTVPATRPDITRTDAGALGASSDGK
jgi:hypothetical protein